MQGIDFITETKAENLIKHKNEQIRIVPYSSKQLQSCVKTNALEEVLVKRKFLLSKYLSKLLNLNVSFLADEVTNDVIFEKDWRRFCQGDKRYVAHEQVRKVNNESTRLNYTGETAFIFKNVPVTINAKDLESLIRFVLSRTVQMGKEGETKTLKRRNKSRQSLKDKVYKEVKFEVTKIVNMENSYQVHCSSNVIQTKLSKIDSWPRFCFVKKSESLTPGETNIALLNNEIVINISEMSPELVKHGLGRVKLSENDDYLSCNFRFDACNGNMVISKDNHTFQGNIIGNKVTGHAYMKGFGKLKGSFIAIHENDCYLLPHGKVQVSRKKDRSILKTSFDQGTLTGKGVFQTETSFLNCSFLNGLLHGPSLIFRENQCAQYSHFVENILDSNAPSLLFYRPMSRVCELQVFHGYLYERTFTENCTFIELREQQLKILKAVFNDGLITDIILYCDMNCSVDGLRALAKLQVPEDKEVSHEHFKHMVKATINTILAKAQHEHVNTSKQRKISHWLTSSTTALRNQIFVG